MKKLEKSTEVTRALWIIRSAMLSRSISHVGKKVPVKGGGLTYVGVMIGTTIDEKSGDVKEMEIFRMKYTSETETIAQMEAFCVSATIQKGIENHDNIPGLINWLKIKVIL